MPHHYLPVPGWFDFDDLYELALRRCGSRPACFVEIGAYLGRSTLYMAERIRETGADISFHVVDSFAGDVHVGYRDLWPAFAANLERAGLLGSVTVHRADSRRAAAAFAPDSVDFAFIDAGHTYEAVSGDIAAWWPRVRPGGLLAGHDYHNFAAVRAAVDRFVSEHALGYAFRVSRSSWAIYKSIRIDAGYCINLPHRPDRRRQASAQFRSAGVDGWVRFFDAIDGRELIHPGTVSDGQAGCAASHLAVLRAAQAQGSRHVLIFEDDVRLVRHFVPQLNAAIARCPASYDLCYVGALCLKSWGNFLHPFDDVLARVGHVYGTHAYLVNVQRAEEIGSGLADLRTVLDHWYARALHARGNCYSCTPYLAFQTPGYSDVSCTHNHDPAICSTYVWA